MKQVKVAGSKVLFNVVRGGAWSNDLPKHLRSALRIRTTIADRYYDIGFRVARTN